MWSRIWTGSYRSLCSFIFQRLGTINVRVHIKSIEDACHFKSKTLRRYQQATVHRQKKKKIEDEKGKPAVVRPIFGTLQGYQSSQRPLYQSSSSSTALPATEALSSLPVF